MDFEDSKEQEKEFLRYLVERIVERLNKVIRNQLYANRYEGLSKSWASFKKRMGLDPGYWIASGQLKDSIQWWYSSKYKRFLVGVHPRLKHRKYMEGGVYKTVKTVKMVDIIRWLEKGTRRGIPARPLFSKVFEEFQKDLDKHYINYLKAG